MRLFGRAVLATDMLVSWFPAAVFVGLLSHRPPAELLWLAKAAAVAWVLAVLVGIPGDLLVLLGRSRGRWLCWAAAALSAASIVLLAARAPSVLDAAQEMGRSQLSAAAGVASGLLGRVFFLVLYVVAVSAALGPPPESAGGAAEQGVAPVKAREEGTS